MTERDKERNETLPPNEFVPGEEDFEDEPEEGEDTEGELSESEADEESADEALAEDESAEEESAAGAAAAVGGSRGRFGFGRARGADEHLRSIGSVRGAHERVHIDDRPSAIFALVCAIGLIGLLAFSYVGGILPKGAAPSLTKLLLATYVPPAGSNASLSTTPSVAPTAAPAASPSPSPTK